MATTALVHPWMSYFAGDRPIIAGVFAEIVAALKPRGAYKDSEHFGNRHHCFYPESLKQVLLELLQASGVNMLFHSFVTGVNIKNGRITSLLLASKSGLEEIFPTLVIDASGDGDIAAWAGAPYEKGRPQDGLMQPMTLHFRMARVAWEKVPSREDMNHLYLTAKASGEINCPRENLLWFDTTIPDQIHFNTTRVTQVDGTDKADLTRAEIESRRQVQEIVAFLQKRVPGFQQAYLSQTGAQIGVRETRRIKGEYVLTGEDVLTAKKFPDGIALSSYPIDVHNPAGEGTVLKYLSPGEFYAIPYRCLVPQKIDNLLVAGRPISTTHEAHASTRVQVVCYATGQAAGVAATLALQNNLSPREATAIEIQQALRKQGAILE